MTPIAITVLWALIAFVVGWAICYRFMFRPSQQNLKLAREQCKASMDGHDITAAELEETQEKLAAALQNTVVVENSFDEAAAKASAATIEGLNAENQKLSGANRALSEQLKACEKITVEITEKAADDLKGFEVFRASDARMRALRKAPAKIYNPIAKWLNGTIKDGKYKAWKNPPTPMKPK